RQPFPGPGLAVRILGEVTADRVTVLQEADAIVIEEIRRADLYDNVWQSFAVLLPISTVGVMGDNRTYDNAVALRVVESLDGMTADWARLPYEVLHRISSRIVSEVRGVNRVVYDISSKPPSTIEWELPGRASVRRAQASLPACFPIAIVHGAGKDACAPRRCSLPGTLNPRPPFAPDKQP